MDLQNLFIHFNAETERQEYRERAQRFIDKLDFKKLAEIREKPLEGLTEDDLFAIGFLPHPSHEFEKLYYFSDLDNIKVYLTIEDGIYNIRRYRLQLDKTVTSTAELMAVTLIDWKLKMD
ncbi:hypothetical protein [Chitinophaga cymbidii]|uniref:Uncharacterized protein n=1 Tax=Chitinophaga cymbidii TaxID=1096750 RepID=A0A512RS49_9BACT|nr:hypothetical protein [Chitinophaga cymbidii]GEP98518.1 hypothetical protein CCY01nite_47780 [Chitinophaga cymbidii]